MPDTRTTKLPRRIAENVAMGALIAGARVLLPRTKVQTLVRMSERTAKTLAVVTPFHARGDTLARGRELAYRWSRRVHGSHCLHRALATRVWLAAYRIDSRIVLGFRKREAFEGHAWLEVPLDDAATLIFVADEDGYAVAIDSR